MDFKEELYTFPSGLKLVFVQASGYYTSNFKILFKVGAEDEQKECGISHLIEHCVFKGTKNYSQEEIAAKFDAISADVDASTSSEFTSYKAVFPKPSLEEVLSLFSDMIFNSVFDKNELEKEKRVIIEEIKMRQDIPDQLAFDNLIKMMYKGTGIGNDIAGKISLLNAVTQEDMLEYKNAYYNAKNAVISVVGDYSKDYVISLIEKYFNSKFKGCGTKQKVWSRGLISRSEKKIEIKQTNQANIILAYKTKPYEDLDRLKLGIFAYILGGSMSSRLFTRIRNELSLCYSVYCFCMNYKDSGFMGISLATSPENVTRALEEVKSELNKIIENGITDEEFNAAKTMRLNKLLMEQDSPKVALSYLAYTGRLLDNKLIENTIKSLTKQDVMEAVKNTIKQEDVFVSYVGKKVKGL